MACFPGLAQADNAGIQYETDVPTVPGNEGSDIPSTPNDSGGSNAPDGSGPDASTSNTAGGAGSGGSDDPGTGGGAHPGQPNQGSGGGDGQAPNGSKPAGGVGEAKQISVAPVSETSSDDSSPLVPILIAIAVLAAISIGAFFYRQRRQDAGSPVSPKAS
jgi:hypothetical protein